MRIQSPDSSAFIYQNLNYENLYGANVGTFADASQIFIVKKDE